MLLVIPLLGIIISCSTLKDVVTKSTNLVEKTSNTSTINKNEDNGLPVSLRELSPYLKGKWIGEAISYGCYRQGQAPGVNGPSEKEILEDLNILSKHWNLIRVYGSDDDSERVLRVIYEYKLPFKVMLGIWLANESDHPEQEASNIAQVTRGIELANKYPDQVLAINVGNETQVFWSWHRMESKNLIKYIRQVREATTVPVTTADDYNFWNKPESRQVTSEIDFIVLHAYALWNGQQLGHAVQWTDSVYQDIKARYSDKTIVLGETGWATKYNADKKGPGEQGTLIKGEVGLKAQEVFINGLHEWVIDNQVTTFLFEAFNEPWKGGGEQSGPNEVEKNWGVFYEDRTPKESFSSYLNQLAESSE